MAPLFTLHSKGSRAAPPGARDLPHQNHQGTEIEVWLSLRCLSRRTQILSRCLHTLSSQQGSVHSQDPSFPPVSLPTNGLFANMSSPLSLNCQGGSASLQYSLENRGYLLSPRWFGASPPPCPHLLCCLKHPGKLQVTFRPLPWPCQWPRTRGELLPTPPPFAAA